MKLFWKELKQLDGTVGPGKFGQGTLWASLQNVEVNAAKLEHLFESRSKEAPTSKVRVDTHWPRGLEGWEEGCGFLWGPSACTVTPTLCQGWAPAAQRLSEDDYEQCTDLVWLTAWSVFMISS